MSKPSNAYLFPAFHPAGSPLLCHVFFCVFSSPPLSLCHPEHRLHWWIPRPLTNIRVCVGLQKQSYIFYLNQWWCSPLLFFHIVKNNSQNRIASLSWSQCIQAQSSNRRYKAAVKLDLGQCRSHWDISIKLPVRSPIIKCIKYVLCHLQRAGNTSTKLSHYSQSYVIWSFIDVIWPLDGSVD